MPSNKPQLTIHLDPGLLEQVEQIAERRGWSKNQTVNWLLLAGLAAVATHTTTTTESSPQ